MLTLFTKRKNQSLFERLISNYHSALYKHALWITGKHDVAADMVQEAYFQAWKCIDSLKSEESALPWLLTILRRAIYREQRCQYRQVETVLQLSVINEPNIQTDECSLLAIYSALERISTKHRDVFLLHFLHGFSYDEISEQLEIPKGTVMSRLSRAREALQLILENSNFSNVIHLESVIREQYKDG